MNKELIDAVTRLGNAIYELVEIEKKKKLEELECQKKLNAN